MGYFVAGYLDVPPPRVLPTRLYGEIGRLTSFSFFELEKIRDWLKVRSFQNIDVFNYIYLCTTQVNKV